MTRSKYSFSNEQFDDALKDQERTARAALATGRVKEFGMPLVVTYELEINEDTGEPCLPDTARIVVHGMANFGGEEGRAMLYALGRLKAQEQTMPIACFVVAEAWAATWAANTPAPYDQPSDDPNRREIVTMAGMTIDRRVNFARIDLSRDDDDYLIIGDSHFELCGDKGGPEMGNNLGAAFYSGYISVVEEIIKDRVGMN